MGKGRSSFASAFDHNVEAEVAQVLQGGYVTVMLDQWKAFETVPPAVLMREAAALKYPLRLMAMLLIV